MIKIKNVFKSYFRGAQEVKVLSDLSLFVEKGSFTALMGPSGSGKSTLLNLIAGIDQPDSGSVCINENQISNLNETTNVIVEITFTKQRKIRTSFVDIQSLW